jgi:uncharacterized protein (DUF4415 family)
MKKARRRRSGTVSRIMAMAAGRKYALKKVGELYRPIKRPVTMRLDADVVEWLKREGRGYQTKANAILRQAMVRDAGRRR